ncbi:MAG: hypothetical protein HZA24_04020 [Nitrospirae bacterium]|nr:hypothetical protein [Nitrospirota bacterium]
MTDRLVFFLQTRMAPRHVRIVAPLNERWRERSAMVESPSSMLCARSSAQRLAAAGARAALAALLVCSLSACGGGGGGGIGSTGSGGGPSQLDPNDTVSGGSGSPPGGTGTVGHDGSVVAAEDPSLY